MVPRVGGGTPARNPKGDPDDPDGSTATKTTSAHPGQDAIRHSREHMRPSVHLQGRGLGYHPAPPPRKQDKKMRDELRQAGVVKKQPLLKTIEALKMEHTHAREGEEEHDIERMPIQADDAPRPPDAQRPAPEPQPRLPSIATFEHDTENIV